MAVDIMNFGFPNRTRHVQGQQIRIQCYGGHYQSPGRSTQKMTKHTQKQKQNVSLGSLGAFLLLIAENAPKTLKARIILGDIQFECSRTYKFCFFDNVAIKFSQTLVS